MDKETCIKASQLLSEINQIDLNIERMQQDYLLQVNPRFHYLDAQIVEPAIEQAKEQIIAGMRKKQASLEAELAKL